MRKLVYLSHKDIWEMIKYIQDKGSDKSYDIKFNLLNSITSSAEFTIE